MDRVEGWVVGGGGATRVRPTARRGVGHRSGVARRVQRGGRSRAGGDGLEPEGPAAAAFQRSMGPGASRGARHPHNGPE